MVNKLIKSFLNHGDYVKIAKTVGYTNPQAGRVYVGHVINGNVPANRGLALDILKAAKVLAKFNQAGGMQENDIETLCGDVKKTCPPFSQFGSKACCICEFNQSNNLDNDN